MHGTIDLDAIRVFVRVAELGSFRGAADALAVPKSTVSRRVAELEAHLGTALLQRTTRKVALTDGGAAYLRACQPALLALEDAGRAVGDTSAEARGRLRVTAAITFGERFLGPVVADYLRRHPAVSVDVQLSDRHVDLVQEGFDLAFRAGALPDSSLVARELGRAHARCFASPRYLETRGKLRTPSDLGKHACIVYAPLAPGGRWSFRVQNRRVQVPVSGRTTLNSMPLTLEAAVHALGVVRLPEFFAEEAVKNGTLVEVLAPFIETPNRFYVVYPSARHVPLRVRAFVDVALEHFELGRWGGVRVRR